MLDNENKLAALCKAKTAESFQSKTVRLCPSLSLPTMHTLQWPELWNSFPTGPRGTETDREGYMWGEGEEKEEDDSNRQAHIPFLFINRQFKWVWEKKHELDSMFYFKVGNSATGRPIKGL